MTDKIIYARIDNILDLPHHRTAILLGLDPDKWGKIKKYEVDGKLSLDRNIEAHLLLTPDQRLILLKLRMKGSRLGPAKELMARLERDKFIAPTTASDFLGFPHGTYNRYKNGSARVQRPIVYSIEAHLLLPAKQFDYLMDDRKCLTQSQ